MGFFDFFKNLFGGAKPTIDTSNLTIDVAKNVMSVNGTAVEIPCPKGPVVTSTPGVWPRSGWPGVLDPHWRKLFSSSRGRS